MEKVVKLLFVALLFPAAVQAASVTLAWDPSPSPNIDGYGIFDKNYQKPYSGDTPIWEGNATVCTVVVPDDRQTAFVARAFKLGPYDLQGNRVKDWSDNSNEVVFKPVSVKPEPPRNMLIRIFAAIGKFFKTLFG